MTCPICGDKERRRAAGLCKACYDKKWRRDKAKSLRRRDKWENPEQDRRDLLNAHRGAEKALRQLIAQYPEMDFTGAMEMCRERIRELSNGY